MSPLHHLEPYFVSMLIERSRMRQPITSGGFVKVTNSLIVGTKEQQDLIKYKILLKVKQKKEELGYIVMSCWKKFFLRFKDVLTANAALTYDRKEREWEIMENFKQMYDQVYERMVFAGAVVKSTLLI